MAEYFCAGKTREAASIAASTCYVTDYGW